MRRSAQAGAGGRPGATALLNGLAQTGPSATCCTQCALCHTPAVCAPAGTTSPPSLVRHDALGDVSDDLCRLLHGELDLVEVVHDLVQLLRLVVERRRRLRGAARGRGGKASVSTERGPSGSLSGRSLRGCTRSPRACHPEPAASHSKPPQPTPSQPTVARRNRRAQSPRAPTCCPICSVSSTSFSVRPSVASVSCMPLRPSFTSSCIVMPASRGVRGAHTQWCVGSQLQEPTGRARQAAAPSVQALGPQVPSTRAQRLDQAPARPYRLQPVGHGARARERL